MQINKWYFLLLIVGFSFSLSAQDEFESDRLASKCLTFKPKNYLTEHIKSHSEILVYNRPVLQKSAESKSKRFLIHYDVTGKNAVPADDRDKNGISDFVDSALIFIDWVYEVECNELHYVTPRSDDSAGGTPAYDIYMMNIGDGGSQSQGSYGFTYPEYEYSSTYNRSKYTSYIVIDNDYSEKDSSNTTSGKRYRTFYDTSYTALKITLAHEYHHAIQFTYGDDLTSRCLNEMTSTWMEYRLVPYTVDFLQYVRLLFRDPRAYPFGNGLAETGYLYSILCHYLKQNFGDSVLLRMWEIMSVGNQGYKSLDMALQERNTNLADEWCKQLEWLYYTGKRAKPDKYFKLAAMFPEVKFYKDEAFISPTYTHSGGLLAFEFRFFRIWFSYPDQKMMTPDTVDIILTDTDTQSAILQGDREMPYSIAISSDQIAGGQIFGNINKYYYKLTTPQGNICDDFYFSQGELTKLICYAYPNPFLTQKDQEMVFPAPDGAPVGAKLEEFYIMNSSMEKVFESSSLIVGINDQNRSVILSDNIKNLSTGVYLFHSKYKSNECSGKFAIINQK